MFERASNATSAGDKGLTWRGLLAVAALGVVWPLFIYFSVIPAARTLTHGFAAYYGAARVLLDGNMALINDVPWFHAQLAQMGFGAVTDVGHQNPPTFGLLMLPIAGLPPNIARFWWTACNVVFLLATWVVLARVAHAHAPVPTGWGTRLIAFGVLLALLGSTWENVRWGQVYLLLVLLISLSLWAVLSQRYVLAGLLIVPLLVSKPYYAAFVLLALALHRRWQAIAVSLIGATFVVISFWPLAGLDAWTNYAAFVPTINNLPYASHTSHQTLNGLARRLFIYHQVWNPYPLVPAGEGAVTVFRIVTTVTLLIFTIREVLRRNEKWHSFATLLLLAPIISPAGEPHHLAMATLGIGYNVLRRKILFTAWAAVGIGLLILPWPIREQALWSAGWTLLAYPYLYGAIILLVALLRARADASQGPSRPLAGDAPA